MKKFISFILAAISIFSISILFTGCGTQTVDDITGEYILIKDGKEIKQDNKQYYLIVLQKDITHKNKPAIQLRFTEQRYNQDLNKYYYVNRDFYIDPQTLQSFESEKHHFSINDNKNILVNNVEYKKISSNIVKKDDTDYTAYNLIQELVKIPKYNNLHYNRQRIRDEFSGYMTELEKLVYY